MKQTTFYLVRHGETELNRADISGGHIDTPLTPRGRKQALETGRRLADIEFDEIYSSDLSRAIDTAGLIAGREVPLRHRLPQLRERYFGPFEGVAQHQYREWQQSVAHLPQEQRIHQRAGDDMESDHDVGTRFVRALSSLARTHPGKTMLVVAHASGVRTTLVTIGHFHIDEVKPGTFKNGGVVHMTYDGTNFSVKAIDGYSETPVVTD